MKRSPYKSITATELARNLSAAVDQVRFSGQGLLITKGSRVVAELSPPPYSTMTNSGLAELLRSLPKISDGEGMAKDIQLIKSNASLPPNKWDR